MREQGSCSRTAHAVENTWRMGLASASPTSNRPERKKSPCTCRARTAATRAGPLRPPQEGHQGRGRLAAAHGHHGGSSRSTCSGSTCEPINADPAHVAWLGPPGRPRPRQGAVRGALVGTDLQPATLRGRPLEVLTPTGGRGGTRIPPLFPRNAFYPSYFPTPYVHALLRQSMLAEFWGGGRPAPQRTAQATGLSPARGGRPGYAPASIKRHPLRQGNFTFSCGYASRRLFRLSFPPFRRSLI